MAISILQTTTHTLVNTNLALVAGTNRYLVMVTGTATGSTQYFNSITINGKSFTKIGDNTNTARVQWWGCVIPDAWGTSTVTITSSQTGSTLRVDRIMLGGVDPDSPIRGMDQGGSGSGSSTSNSRTINIHKDGIGIDVISLANASYEPNAGAGQSVFYRASARSSSRKTVASTGNTTMSWTFGGSRNAACAVSLEPYIPPPPVGSHIRWFI